MDQYSTLSWILDRRDLHLPVTVPILCAKGKDLICPDQSDFKASDGWSHKFMRCYNLVLRAKTSLAQKLPGTLEEIIKAFQKQLKRVKEVNSFGVIGNMDETPLFFDVISGRIIDSKGKKSITVLTTGSEKKHLTVKFLKHFQVRKQQKYSTYYNYFYYNSVTFKPFFFNSLIFST